MKIGIDTKNGKVFTLQKKKVDTSWKGTFKKFGADWAGTGKQFVSDWADFTEAEVKKLAGGK